MSHSFFHQASHPFRGLALVAQIVTVISCLAQSVQAGVTILHEGAPFVGVSAVAVSPDGNTLYVGDPFDDKIYAMPAIGGTPVQISSGTLGSVADLEVSADGTTIFATLALRGLAPSVVSLPAAGDTATVLASFTSRPGGLCISPDGTELFVTLKNLGSIVRLPTAGGAPTDLFPFAFAAPTDVVVHSGDNALLFTSDGVTNLYKVPVTGGLPTAIPIQQSLGEPVAIALSPDQASVYIYDTGLHTIFEGLAAGGTLSSIFAGEGEFYLNGKFALSPSGDSIYFGGYRADSGGQYAVFRLDRTVAVENARWGEIKALFR